MEPTTTYIPPSYTEKRDPREVGDHHITNKAHLTDQKREEKKKKRSIDLVGSAGCFPFFSLSRLLRHIFSATGGIRLLLLRAAHSFPSKKNKNKEKK
jgi:hypothetical protein